MHYLITGGLGYLGGRLIEYLLEKGHSVSVTTRGDTGNYPDLNKKVEIQQVNTSLEGNWSDALDGVDFIFHLAAPDAEFANRDPVSAINAGSTMTWQLLEGISRVNKRIPVINLSTFHVYGPKAQGVVSESIPPDPQHPYSISQFFSETVARYFVGRNDLQILNVRLSNAFGRPLYYEMAKWSLVFNDLCRQAAISNRLCLNTAGHQRRSFITMEDAIRALCFLADQVNDWPEDHVVNLGSTLHWSIREVAELVAERCKVLWDKTVEIVVPEDPTSVQPPAFSFDVSRLKQMGFAWKNQYAREIDDTLIACREWSKHG